MSDEKELDNNGCESSQLNELVVAVHSGIYINLI